MALKYNRLTRAIIRRSMPGEKITEHGITAERLTDGDTRYSVNIMVDGQRIHRVIGLESDNTTRTQAENFISKVRAEAKENRLSLPKGRKMPLTFERASELYITNENEIEARDIGSKERHLKLHLNPYLGKMRLDRITEFTIEKLRNELRAKGFAEGGVNRILATYRHMANRLTKLGATDAPLPFIKLRRVENRRNVVLSIEEEGALLAAALNDPNTYIWLFLKLGLGTGMRHREILSARFENIDEKRRRIRVQVKGGRWREQPLSEDLTELLAKESDMADDGLGWVFPNQVSTSGHYDSMKKPFRRVVMAAGLDPTKITPHTMRHTAITNFAETGADIRTIQQFSGHETIEMVMRYTHARDERVDDALQKMERARTKPVQINARKVEDS